MCFFFGFFFFCVEKSNETLINIWKKKEKKNMNFFPI